MQRLFGSSVTEEEGSEWLSVSDLMAGLMVIFLFIAIVFIRPLAEQNRKISEIAATWQENETAIYQALLDEFAEDLPKWNAELDKDTLLVRFKAPEVLFEMGDATLRPQFKAILSDFFPRYVRVLGPFQESIEEVRIEGHTSAVWNNGTSDFDAYFLNMELSQERTREVLRYSLSLSAVAPNRSWLQGSLTANGLSSSQPVLDYQGTEDPDLSRRVEFRIRTKARQEIVQILEATQ